MTTATIIGIKFKIETCCNCGMVFAMPEEVQAKFKREGGSFYCPAGHSQHYTKSDLSILQERLDRQAKLTAEAEQRARLAQIERDTAKADMKRLKLRAAAGVCPCCNRTFDSLAQHMKTKHPEYSPEKKAAKRGRPRKTA